MQEFKTEHLTVRIYPTRKELGLQAAITAAATLRYLLANKKTINIIFAAAPSQQEFLEALRVQPGIDWHRVSAFHMDEYIGLAAEAPQGFGNFLRSRIFSQVDFHAVHYIDGQAGESAAVKYAALLEVHPPDVVFMGIGENGHLAFNDPPVANFHDTHPVKVVELDAMCRQQQVNDGCFGELAQVPTHAITLTIPALMQAPYIYCMVPGATKQQAVYNTLHQSVHTEFPSTILRTHPGAILFLDEQSSELLATKKH
ncbi:6-phosphogluconolactonase [Chitinophaga sp. sic0106]|uniref:6-phosphogluconolactonase n=1 Tax=Chitinophaga sp. sic0106 TaxID=2854785 RepID=UPI001C477C89|nr:6-phosphogluconolactonase [Chitinophaga sp. sic0106]MBV7529682.1 6-phosphogluconolactonase [Chitinophaga sp. sic0106]